MKGGLQIPFILMDFAVHVRTHEGKKKGKINTGNSLLKWDLNFFSDINMLIYIPFIIPHFTISLSLSDITLEKKERKFSIIEGNVCVCL